TRAEERSTERHFRERRVSTVTAPRWGALFQDRGSPPSPTLVSHVGVDRDISRMVGQFDVDRDGALLTVSGTRLVTFPGFDQVRSAWSAPVAHPSGALLHFGTRLGDVSDSGGWHDLLALARWTMTPVVGRACSPASSACHPRLDGRLVCMLGRWVRVSKP